MTYSGSSYISLSNNNTGNEPDQDQTHWSSVSLGMNWRNDWDSTQTYNEHDAVGFNGSSYICLFHGIHNEEPDQHPEHWYCFAHKGDQGGNQQVTAGPGISVTSNVGNSQAEITISNTGVLQAVPGSGIAVTPTGGTGVVTFSVTGIPSSALPPDVAYTDVNNTFTATNTFSLPISGNITGTASTITGTIADTSRRSYPIFISGARSASSACMWMAPCPTS